MKNAVRITLIAEARFGMNPRKVVLTEPPFPEHGDIVQLEGIDWRVSNVHPCEVIATIPLRRPAR